MIVPKDSELFPTDSEHKCKNYYVGEINAGDVVVLNSDGCFEASSSASDSNVVGIESGDRGRFRLKSGCDEREEQGQRQIGLVGFVLANVTNQGGAINIGDSLVTSDKKGHLKKAPDDAGFRSVVAIARATSNVVSAQIEVIIK